LKIAGSAPCAPGILPRNAQWTAVVIIWRGSLRLTMTDTVNLLSGGLGWALPHALARLFHFLEQDSRLLGKTRVFW